MSDNTNNYRWLQKVIAVVLVAAVAIAIVVFGGQVIEYRSWQALTKSEDADVEFNLRKHLHISSHPQYDLVQALASDKISLSLAARKYLDHQINTWSQKPANINQAEILELVDHLSTFMDTFGPSTQAYAIKLTSNLSTWRFEYSIQNQNRFSTLTDRILYSAEPGPELPSISDKLAAEFELDQTQRRNQIAQVNQLYTVTNTSSPVANTANYQLASVPKTIEPKSISPAPAILSINKFNSVPLDTSPRANQNQAAEASNTPSTIDLSKLPPVPTDLSRWADFQVMQLLNDPRSEVVHRSESELQQRKFTSRDITIAKRLVNPLPKTRLQLVRELPNIKNTNARYWLNILRKDIDPDVRSAATSLLISSNSTTLSR